MRSGNDNTFGFEISMKAVNGITKSCEISPSTSSKNFEGDVLHIDYL